MQGESLQTAAVDPSRRWTTSFNDECWSRPR